MIEVTEYVNVTRVMAATWLSTGVCDRAILPSRVREFASDMLTGQWRQDDDATPIGFGADGCLFNGRHRLFALVLSGVTVRMPVTRGVTSPIVTARVCKAGLAS